MGLEALDTGHNIDGMTMAGVLETSGYFDGQAIIGSREQMPVRAVISVIPPSHRGTLLALA